jgi:hypothetical protein
LVLLLPPLEPQLELRRRSVWGPPLEEQSPEPPALLGLDLPLGLFLGLPLGASGRPSLARILVKAC